MAPQRTVIVTGAASGIGAAIATGFLSQGNPVVLFDLDADGARKVVEDGGHRAKALILQGDASDEGAIQESVARAESVFGPIRVLVNNVGVEINGLVHEQSRDVWDRMVAVNLTSFLLFSKYCIPGMRANSGGAIINIASIHSFQSWPSCAAYDATKAGILGLTRGLAVDYGPDGIRVNAICPGYTRTPLLERWFASIPDGEEKAARAHPLRRIGEPIDIANAALFLASDQASFITGSVLAVDGGLMAAGQ